MTSHLSGYFQPWSPNFQRDGTVQVAAIRDSDGEVIAVSRPFWLPEEDDPIPPVLSAMRLRAGFPKLLTALLVCASLLADDAKQNGEEAYRNAVTVINESRGMNA